MKCRPSWIASNWIRDADSSTSSHALLSLPWPIKRGKRWGYANPRRAKEAGFTLIEILVAIAILASTILSVFSVYSHGILAIRRAKHRTMATQYAQMMMDMICSRKEEVFRYHGLDTSKPLAFTNPFHEDVIIWSRMLATFPTDAVGSITVTEDPIPICAEIDGEEYCAAQWIVTVTIIYDDYGKKTHNVLSMKVPKG